MKKFLFWLIIILLILGGLFWWGKNNKGFLTQKAVQELGKVMKASDFLNEEAKQKFGNVIDIADKILVQDDTTRRYMVFLQNNMELRPGGGFLGQYAIVEIKNGEIVSYKVEDSNNLEPRYKSDREASLELQKYVDIKKWKFRDSNFSPNFPTNVEDALHFYELAGENIDFAGVFAVNVAVLEDILKITGPISVQVEKGGEFKEFTNENVLIALEDAVEEKFLRAEERKACEKSLEKQGKTEKLNEEEFEKCRYDETGKKLKLTSHADEVNRKQILNTMAGEILNKILGEVKKGNTQVFESFVNLGLENLKDKDIQLWFKDENLQKIAQENNWSGEVDQNWEGDFVMIVDANLGALKSDYYMTREMEYIVDFTGSNAEVNDPNAGRMVRYLTPEIKEEVFAGTFKTKSPLATARMIYKNTATEASYRNSDYHCFTRLFVPEGSKWYIREWFEAPLLEKGTFSNKQDFAYKFDVLLGDTIPTMLQYTLPNTITEDGYKLKVQKQSGIGSIPLKVTIIGKNGKKYNQEVTLDKDLVFELKEENGEKKLMVVE
jgi:hypothetical protein